MKSKNKKIYIVPGLEIRALRIVSKIIPDNLMARMAYKVQIRKEK